MRDRVKDSVITLGFCLILIVTFIINLVTKDKEISTSERRKLASFPKITKASIENGELSDKLEKYFVDQFVGRDFFRSFKSFVSLNILGKKDNNELFVKNGSIYKMDYQLKEKNIEKSTEKIMEVYNNYLNGMNVYYSIIPDKNYYLEDDDHLKMDYEKIRDIMGQNLKNMEYIDIFNSLDIEDYYKTDLHWKQENLEDVVNCLENKMNLQETSINDYEVKDTGDFYGVYYGQLGVSVKPDRLKILTNKALENCITYNYETRQKGRIYSAPRTSDKYDTYLSGAVSIISIENPNSKTDKELLLFRDSFGSSIAPLLLSNYKKITLIDMRYVSNKILGQYIDFTNQDVLFLYSTVVLNQNVFR